MRPLAQPLLFALAIGAAGLCYLHLRRSPPAEAPPLKTSSAASPTREPADSAARAHAEPVVIEPALPSVSAGTRTNSGALTELVRHLSSADPDIRGLALDGILQLGDAAGVEPLRAAAGRARDPREAAKLLEAADYLSLPPAPPASGTYKTLSAVGGRRASPAPSRASPPF